MITVIKEPYNELQIKAVLHPLINQWFFSKFKSFSLPQLYGVMEIHQRRNVLISAPTGATKTLTGFLSILNELVDSAKKQILEDKVYAIYISPLKALNYDIHFNLINPLEEIEKLNGDPLGIRVGVRTGDTTAYEKQKMLKHVPHILITTPESLAIMLNSPKFKEKLTDVQWLLVDEIHALADNKRGVHLSLTMERLQKVSPGICRAGLSATVAPLEEVARFLVGYTAEKERDCNIVDVQFIKNMDLQVLSPVKSLVETDYMMKHQKMYDLIDKLVRDHKTTVIFTNTRAATERVVHNLKEMFPTHYNDTNIAAHHGSLGKEARFKTEQDLRDGTLKVVVSSTSLELGIDIGYVDLVICLGSPKSVARFLQRCLPYDSEVLLEDGSYVSIGRIVEDKMSIKVMTYNSKKGYVPQKITHYHKYKGDELIEIVLRCGEKIVCTPEHPLLTKEGWKEAAKITNGDLVAEIQDVINFKKKKSYLYSLLPLDLTYVYNANNFFRDIIDQKCQDDKVSLRRFSELSKTSYQRLIDLRRFSGRKKSILLQDFITVCNYCKIPEKEYVKYLSNLKYKGKSWCKLPLNLNSDLMWVAGLIASDGCIVKSVDKRHNSIYFKVKFGNKNIKLIQKFKQILNKYEISYHHAIRKSDSFHSVEIGNNLLSYLLMSLGIPCKNKSASLKLSSSFFKLDNKLIISFLEGVFEGDGNYNKRYPLLRIFTGSSHFAKQLHYMFARLGLHSHINVSKSKTSKQVPNINLIHIYSVVLTRVLDIKSFFKNIPCLGPKARSSFKLVSEFNQHHEKKSKFNDFVNWENVVSIKRKKNKREVYNLTVEGDSNFIVGNIITHNCGRAGHQLYSTVKGRIIVMDRDDLVECSLLLKSAIEQKIDRIHFPKAALDVLAQHIYGIAINGVINVHELFYLIKNSYCYHNMQWEEFFDVIKYLSGHYASLEDRHVYARIWYDEETGNIGKRGKMARIIYMTNIGTIPEESFVTVKVGTQIVGTIDESFLERLRPGDVFVLGGSVYMFKFSRGMVAQVSTSVNRPPTVPSWSSEQLPLSFDLAMEINRFRRLMSDKLNTVDKDRVHDKDNVREQIKDSGKNKKEEIIKFIKEYLYVEEKVANSIYLYFKEQNDYAVIPSNKTILIESFSDRGMNYVIFNTLFGRRVNDCLSRALAFIIGRSQHRDVEIGVTDNGFYLAGNKIFNALRAFELLKQEKFHDILEQAIDRSEVLQRRFRHCAARSLMILRSYMGQKKSVGRMQVSSRILYNAVQKIGKDFPILKEARREVLDDLMDYENAQLIVDEIVKGKVMVKEKHGELPSPFAFNLIVAGYSDVIKIEDKQEFLRRMHQEVMAKISLKDGKKKIKEKEEEFSYSSFWEKSQKELLDNKDLAKEKLKMQVWQLKRVPIYAKEELIKLIEFGSMRQDIVNEVKKHKEDIEKDWPEELKDFVLGKI